jgi:DNA polymerase III alpha subunit (gram-positive type)
MLDDVFESDPPELPEDRSKLLLQILNSTSRKDQIYYLLREQYHSVYGNPLPKEVKKRFTRDLKYIHPTYLGVK